MAVASVNVEPTGISKVVKVPSGVLRKPCSSKLPKYVPAIAPAGLMLGEKKANIQLKPGGASKVVMLPPGVRTKPWQLPMVLSMYAPVSTPPGLMLVGIVDVEPGASNV